MGDLDNDMDELFRNAANHYPLKTDGADWDKVMGKLPDAVGTPLPLTQQKGNKSNLKLLWLILLFPMGWLCNSYFNSKNNTAKNDEKIVSTSSTKKLNKTTQINDNHSIIKLREKNEYISSKKKTSFIKATNGVDQMDRYDTNTINPNAKNMMLADGTTSNTLDDKKEILKGNVSSNAEKNSIVELTNNNVQLILNNGGISTNFTHQLTMHSTKQSSFENSKINQVDSNQTTKSSIKRDSFQIKQTDTSISIAKKTSPKISEKNKGLYITAIGGLDASSVKNQGVKKVGYSYGFLIGYNLNKHFAIETGLMWDKKQYYTNGEYFNKTRTTIPSNVTILDMNGNCAMFELPVALRYNFGQNKKTLLFGTAGLSSYFMKNEGYDYQSQVNGGTPRYYEKTYSNSGNSFFSVIGLGIGYQHKIGKLASLSINPYLKIPLKGIGIGSLPITSSGVNIGLTIPFHK